MDFNTSRIIYLLILALVACIGLARWQHHNRTFRLITILVLTVLLLDGTSILLFMNGIRPPSMLVLHPVQLILYTMIYCSIFRTKSWKVPVIIISIILGLIVLVKEYFNIINRVRFDPVPNLILNAWYVLLSLMVLLELIRYPVEDETDILKEKVFWFIAGNLFMNTLAGLYWVSAPLISKPIAPIGILIISLINYIYYGFIGYALLIKNPKPAQQNVLHE